MGENASGDSKGVFFSEARKSFHAALRKNVLRADAEGIPSNADRGSRTSVAIAKGILRRLGAESTGARLAGQMAGSEFEEICSQFLKETFVRLSHLRPGEWTVGKHLSGGRLGIAKFDQYEHLAALEDLAKRSKELAAALGSDYLIKPDVVIVRSSETDSSINSRELLVDEGLARLTSLRKINNQQLILHASISCKWTLRSDRAQNARSEAINLVRNSERRLPNVAVVTGEPLPNRIAPIALGTGGIDCTYHFALPELEDTVKQLGFDDAAEMVATMVQGKRLRDISDLPLDLIV